MPSHNVGLLLCTLHDRFINQWVYNLIIHLVKFNFYFAVLRAHGLRVRAFAERKRLLNLSPSAENIPLVRVIMKNEIYAESKQLSLIISLHLYGIPRSLRELQNIYIFICRCEYLHWRLSFFPGKTRFSICAISWAVAALLRVHLKWCVLKNQTCLYFVGNATHCSENTL